MTERPHKNDDLWYALENNPPSMFKPDDVIDIVAEVPGANDEFDWWWVLEMTDGRFFLLSGGCDYTGWDCQSDITEHGYFENAEAAARAAPTVEEYSKRDIQNNLYRQVVGEQPLFLYVEQEL